jgi:peptidoglycan/LPS O-acetylase OafA/YrhL
MNHRPAPPVVNRLYWLDGMKGISILLIVLFHFFSAYDTGRYPWPLGIERFPSFIRQCAGSSFAQTISCFLDACCASILQRGPHAVGVFLILSGFGLTYSLTKTGNPKDGWLRWYGKRLLRLFPMYWMAHVVYLISPLVYRQDPIDYRFFLSLLGDRVFPVDKMFYYINPAWWFFGLLIELYLVFPLLFRLLQRIGPPRYLAVCGVTTMVSQYILTGVLQANGDYAQGAFFGARLWEFALGMSLAAIYRRSPMLVEQWLFSRRTLAAGTVIYVLGIISYQPTFTYIWSDGFIATGFFIITGHVVKAACRARWLGSVLMTVGVYSYGLYLLHQPYVITLGKRLGGLSMFEFLPCAVAIVALIALGSIAIERLVNTLVNRLSNRGKAAPLAAPPVAPQT